MDITRAEQIALDDTLVAPANRLKIGKSNFRLSLDLKSKEATLQVVYDVLKLTPFYKAFQITADVLEIYMQEFWATTTVHHHSIRFKMNNKKHIVNLEYFREMLQICPKLPNQQFEELPFEEAILTFLRDLSHSGEIKMITDVNVNKLHQPWRSFGAVINKCLSGKSTGYDSLRLSQAQILWGIYHKKNVDYAYLLWEDFVFQDQSVLRRNSVNWHYARDDYMFTTIKVVSRHEDTQLYGAEPPKIKESVKKKQIRSDKTTTSLTTKGKRLKTSAKTAKADMKKQPAKTSMDKGLTVLSKVALTEAEQLKLVIERSKTQTHISHASGSSADEGTGSLPAVPDVPTYDSDDEQISWKSSEKDNDDEVNVSEEDDTDNDDDDNDDDVDKDINDDDANNQDKDDQDGENLDDDNEQTDLDNNGDDFVHPKFSTYDEEEIEEEIFDPRVQTPSHVESTNDEEVQGVNIEGEEIDEEANSEESEGNELYIDLNVNLEG
ncbi:hypothetical protein Tco_0010922 [Tanacetum coccineum]